MRCYHGARHCGSGGRGEGHCCPFQPARPRAPQPQSHRVGALARGATLWASRADEYPNIKSSACVRAELFLGSRGFRSDLFLESRMQRGYLFHVLARHPHDIHSMYLRGTHPLTPPYLSPPTHQRRPLQGKGRPLRRTRRIHARMLKHPPPWLYRKGG